MSVPWPDRVPARVAIVGAGLAGLRCARILLEAGLDVHVYEAEEQVGGRVRTTVTPDGYRIDRGFQVLFAAYPALLRAVELADLVPRYIPAGVRVVTGQSEHVLAHPLFDPSGIAATLRSSLVKPADVVALGRLLLSSWSLGDAALRGDGISTAEWLRSRSGLSAELLEWVIRPLFAGVSLDPDLTSDSVFFRFVMRYFSLGRVFLPARGVSALPDLLGRDIPAERMHLGSPVTIARPGDGIEVVGQWRTADAVVVATDLPAALRLAGTDLLFESRFCTTVYFASALPVIEDGRLLLHANGSTPAVVNHALQLTKVSSEYAPPGRHLLSATILGDIQGSDADIAKLALDDLQSWYPSAQRTELEPVAVVRVPFAQFAQEPGIYDRLPTPWTRTPNLYLAGEFLHSSSVQGALRGGEMAASAVLADLNA